MKHFKNQSDKKDAQSSQPDQPISKCPDLSSGSQHAKCLAQSIG